MMRFMVSRFAQWCNDHQPPPLELDSVLREEALNALVESVNEGEITSLDGVESPLSKQISALHGLSHFEMNRSGSTRISSGKVRRAASWAGLKPSATRPFSFV
ncbi:hypothetical protein [Crenobacter cavernae]|uniref:hypothetical protein n=1 Tax=Crenobacter cavernae TaxID=2290923 RepID=UPI0011C05297|nr:hypothetical protein [Crenobacter cavernae]